MFVGLDLETTGVNPKTCHILEIAMVGCDENLHELFTFRAFCQTPLPHSEWKGASEINGIVPRMLKGAMLWEDARIVVRNILCMTPTIVGHNVKRYDLQVLRSSGVIEVDGCPVIDTMKELTRPGKKWPKLSEAAQRFDVSIGELHSALDDTRLSLRVARAAGLLKASK